MADRATLIVEQKRERGNPLSGLDLRTAVDENVLQKALLSADQNDAAIRAHLPVEELPNEVYSDNQLKLRQDKELPHKGCCSTAVRGLVASEARHVGRGTGVARRGSSA